MAIFDAFGSLPQPPTLAPDYYESPGVPVVTSATMTF